jgi:hypothetical protein
MKQYLKERIMEKREERIIQYIEKNPFCTRDSIFTKGNIPKSNATNNLIDDLISQKKLKTTKMKKNRYYVNNIDFLSRFEIFVKDYEYETKKDPVNSIDKIIIKFLKTRLKVLRSEKKKISKLNFRTTIKILNEVLEYYKKPNEFNYSKILTLTIMHLQNDKYYLNHQIHSNPKEKIQKFQKIKKRNVRRSIENLFEMKKKGRRDFGLTKKDYQKNMKKLTDDPSEWWRRFNAEQNRTLYSNNISFQSALIEKTLKKSKKQQKKVENSENPTIDNTSSNRKQKFEKLNKNAMSELEQIMKLSTKN